MPRLSVRIGQDGILRSLKRLDTFAIVGKSVVRFYPSKNWSSAKRSKLPSMRKPAFEGGKIGLATDHRVA
jgi:hypothetical protein